MTSATLAVALTLSATTSSAAPGSNQAQKAAPMAKTAKVLPDGYIANAGQWPSEAKFAARSGGVNTWITEHGIVYDFYKNGESKWSLDPKSVTKSRTGHVVNLEFPGSSAKSSVMGVEKQERGINYVGADGGHSASTFKEARITQLYGGVDLRIYKDSNYPRFDFVVAPNADPSAIKLRFNGATHADKVVGGLSVGTSLGDMKIGDLKAFQQASPDAVRTTVQTSFRDNGDGTFGFNVGPYDHSKTLTIDPVVYSTLIGSPGGDDICFSAGADSLQAPIVAGTTDTLTFPTTPGSYSRVVSGTNVFVSKFTVDARNLQWSTIITTSGVFGGPPNTSKLSQIAVDKSGRVYAAGETTGGFPVTANAYQSNPATGSGDAYYFRLAANGASLEYATYLGTGGTAAGIGLDGSNNVFIAGTLTGPFMQASASAFQKAYKGGQDGYIISIASNDLLGYATYLGGSQNDSIRGIVVDPIGEAYVCGSTSSVGPTPFPTTAGVFDRSAHGGDGFITKFAIGGAKLVYSTLLGGSNFDQCTGIAIDPTGNAYVIGDTASVDFPTTAGAFGTVLIGGQHFSTKIAIDGATLIYSTFMNGGGVQTGVGVDDEGFLYISGWANNTLGGGIVIVNPDQTSGNPGGYNGPLDITRIGDAYLQVLNNTGTQIIYGTYWGGQEDDQAWDVFVDASRNAYLVGNTNSYVGFQRIAFPTTGGVFQEGMVNDNPLGNPPLPFWDGFLSKFKIRPIPFLAGVNVNPGLVAGTQTAQGTINLSAPASTTGAAVTVTSSDPGTVQLIDKNGNPTSTIVTFIAGGGTSGTFVLRTSDVITTVTAKITATLESEVRVTSITVVPWVQNFTLAPFTIVGGNVGTGRIDLAVPAPAGGMDVLLTSSDPSKAVPIDVVSGLPITDVKIAAGLSTVTFNLKTVGVDKAVTVTIRVQSESPTLAAVKAEKLQIIPAHLQGLLFTPNVVNGGSTATGTIQLDGQAGPTPIVVTLVAGNGGAKLTFPSPPNITIPRFTTSANFTVGTGVVTLNDFRVVNAERANGEIVSATLFIQAINIASLDLNLNNVLGGTVAIGHVTLTNSVAPGGFQVVVKSLNPSYAKLTTMFPRTVAPSGQIKLDIPTGQVRSADFFIWTQPEQFKKSIVLQVFKAGYFTKQAVLTLRPLIITGFTLSPKEVIGGVANSTGTITTNEAAPNIGITYKLSTSYASGAVVPFTAVQAFGSKTVTFTVTSKEVASQKIIAVNAAVVAQPAEITASAVLTVDPLGVFIKFVPPSVTGGQVSNATISVTAAPTSPLTVSLTSSDPAAAKPPATATIPAAQKQVTVPIQTFPVAADESVKISVSLGSGVANFGLLEVLSPRLKSLTVSPGVVVGGSNVRITATLDSAAASVGAPVVLTSDTPGVISPPSPLTVLAGRTSNFEEVKTAAVATDTTVTITGIYPSGYKLTATVVVQSPRIGSFTLTPSETTGGFTVKGKVSISTPAPAGGLTVQLAASPGASGTPYVHFPSSVNIPAGATTVSFTVTTDPVSRQVSTQITATFGANTGTQSATLTLDPS